MFDLKDQQHIETMAAIILAGMYACPDPIKDAPKRAMDQAFEIRRMFTDRFSALMDDPPSW